MFDDFFLFVCLFVFSFVIQKRKLTVFLAGCT